MRQLGCRKFENRGPSSWPCSSRSQHGLFVILMTEELLQHPASCHRCCKSSYVNGIRHQVASASGGYYWGVGLAHVCPESVSNYSTVARTTSTHFPKEITYPFLVLRGLLLRAAGGAAYATRITHFTTNNNNNHVVCLQHHGPALAHTFLLADTMACGLSK
jgi:hypothetical protein